MVWVVSHFFKQDSTVHFEGKVWKMKRRIVGNIFAIGMSPFLMNVDVYKRQLPGGTTVYRYRGTVGCPYRLQ